MPNLREYELVYILKPDLGDEELPASVEKVNQMVATRGGEVYETVNTPPWGKRKLAYQIDRYGDGIYVLNHLRLDPETAADFERFLRINDDVMRHILVRMDV